MCGSAVAEPRSSWTYFLSGALLPVTAWLFGQGRGDA
jgi:hypothetical protein